MTKKKGEETVKISIMLAVSLNFSVPRPSPPCLASPRLLIQLVWAHVEPGSDDIRADAGFAGG
jgi:hypothetical protein